MQRFLDESAGIDDDITQSGARVCARGGRVMKILLVSSSSGSRGGGEVFLLYLGRALAQRGHRVVLWASDDSGMDELSNSFTSVGEVIRSRAHQPAAGP